MLKKIGMLMTWLAMTFMVQAQQNLGELVAEAGVDWMIGQWQFTTDNGDDLILEFGADLDKHMGTVRYKDQRTESKGIVLLDPSSKEVKYYSVNNRGAFGTGTWTVEDNKAVLKFKQTDADGATMRMGLAFAKVDANTMEVQIFELGDSDKLGDEARFTAKFKRKK